MSVGSESHLLAESYSTKYSRFVVNMAEFSSKLRLYYTVQMAIRIFDYRPTWLSSVMIR